MTPRGAGLPETGGDLQGDQDGLFEVGLESAEADWAYVPEKGVGNGSQMAGQGVPFCDLRRGPVGYAECRSQRAARPMTAQLTEDRTT